MSGGAVPHDVDVIRAEIARAKPHTTTMNLVVWNADAENKHWVVERANALSEKHPSRTIVLDASPGAADATVTPSLDPQAEQSVRIELGVAGLDAATICELTGSLLAPEVPTELWWSTPPIGPATPFAPLVELAEAVVVDSSSGASDDETVHALAEFVAGRRGGATIRDLAWLRCHAWQEMAAHFFDDPHLREELFSLRGLEIISGSDAEALYLAGWLGSRLGWSATERHGFLDRSGNPIVFKHLRAGRPRRIRSIALRSETTLYKAERLASDDLIVQVWAEGTYAAVPQLFNLQWVDGASLVEKAILEGTSDEIFETALRMVGTLLKTA